MGLVMTYAQPSHWNMEKSIIYFFQILPVIYERHPVDKDT